MFKMATILKFLKQFRPLANSTDIFRQKTCLQNVVKINLNIWSLPRSHTSVRFLARKCYFAGSSKDLFQIDTQLK